MIENSIVIIAGENSGEKYGANLVHQFKKIYPSINFFGIGGKYMSEEGVRLLFSIKNLSVVGAFELLSKLSNIKKIFCHVKKEIRLARPIAAVLIDSPDFNLRLAKFLRKEDIPILYYISPTIWAWRKKRLKIIKKTVTKMMLIFPFEEKIYKEHCIPAVYIGHPLNERIKISLSRKEFFKKYSLDIRRKLIAILPGSRQSEIKYHMPILSEGIKKIQTAYNSQFVLPVAENLNKSFISEFIPDEMNNIKFITKDKFEALYYSNIVLSASGTANLEAALLETPLISFYRISPFSYFLGNKFVKIRNYSIVNILAGKKIIPELIQNRFTPENLFLETKKILDSEKIRLEMTTSFKEIKSLLGESAASQNAARELQKIINYETVKEG